MLAAIDDRQVGYIETHGTGTPLGDAIEIEALRNVYAPRPQDQRCALGSVKVTWAIWIPRRALPDC